MTVSVRHPAIRIAKPPARPKLRSPQAAISARVAAPPAAVRAISDVRERYRRQSPAYRYTLTSFDRVFHEATESPETIRAEQRHDRRTAAVVLTVGMLAVVVVTIALALFLHEIFQLSSSILG